MLFDGLDFFFRKGNGPRVLKMMVRAVVANPELAELLKDMMLQLLAGRLLARTFYFSKSKSWFLFSSKVIVSEATILLVSRNLE